MEDNLRLEFNHKIMIEYHSHTKLATDIIYNPNAMTFTSSNEKGIHVWIPESGETLFQIAFEIGGNYDQIDLS